VSCTDLPRHRPRVVSQPGEISRALAPGLSAEGSAPTLIGIAGGLICYPPLWNSASTRAPGSIDGSDSPLEEDDNTSGDGAEESMARVNAESANLCRSHAARQRVVAPEPW